MHIVLALIVNLDVVFLSHYWTWRL